MRTTVLLLTTLFVTATVVGCAAAPTPVPPTAAVAPPTATPVPPTATPVPSTATAIPPTVTPQPTKPLGTPIIPPLVAGPIRGCIEQKIGGQPRMDIQEGRRVATTVEESAIRDCMAQVPPPPGQGQGQPPPPVPQSQNTPVPIVAVTIPPVEDSAVLECIAQKIGPRAVYEIQQNIRAATPEEGNAIRSCPRPWPTGTPPPGSAPAPVGRLVVINHRGQDAYMTLGGRAQRITKDSGRMDWGGLAPGRQPFSLDIGGKGVDCSQFNGCAVEIVVNKDTTLDLW